MSLPKKPLSDPQSKTTKPHQSASHPPRSPEAESLLRVAKPMKVGTGQSRVNLMRSDLDEYARSHAGGAACSNAGPGLLQKVSDGFKGLLKKLTKTP
jgi:hypothetical protein